MEQPLTYLKQRVGEDWLIGYDTNQFNYLTEQLFQQLSQQGTPPKILLAEQNPWRFLAAFLAAVAADCPVFLCNPNWVEQEWQQVFDIVQPDLIWGNLPEVSNSQKLNVEQEEFRSSEVHEFRRIPNPRPQPSTLYKQTIMIPTGGSSGKIRFAIHTWETLMASVRGFYHYFGEKPINSCCVLPLYHVSGLMQFLRSFTTGGQLMILPFKALVAGEGRDIDPTTFFLSLVPTQLARLISLEELTTWLSRFQAVLLGGAPAWTKLLEQARHYNIPLALTYGMTETASQVVTLKPEAFRRGNNSCGQVLPHAQVSIRSATGERLGANQIGNISINADSLALGYYPELFPNPQYFQPDDLGFFDNQGFLNVVGRNSNKIITGGENVFPTEVEAAIRATQLIADVCVIGIPDLEWGQAVTAIYVSRTQAVSTALLEKALADKLSKYKRPKYWVSVKSLPRNSQGKVNYEQLQEIVIATLESQKSSLSAF